MDGKIFYLLLVGTCLASSVSTDDTTQREGKFIFPMYTNGEQDPGNGNFGALPNLAALLGIGRTADENHAQIWTPFSSLLAAAAGTQPTALSPQSRADPGDSSSSTGLQEVNTISVSPELLPALEHLAIQQILYRNQLNSQQVSPNGFQQFPGNNPYFFAGNTPSSPVQPGYPAPNFYNSGFQRPTFQAASPSPYPGFPAASGPAGFMYSPVNEAGQFVNPFFEANYPDFQVASETGVPTFSNPSQERRPNSKFPVQQTRFQ